MSFPRGATRGKSWGAPWQPTARRSVTVAGPEGFEATYERGEASNADAIDAVVEHARIMAKFGAWLAGRYRFRVAGTKERREVELAGPRMGDA